MQNSLNTILFISDQETFTTDDIQTVLTTWNQIKGSISESISTFIASLIGDITERYCLQN